MHNPTRGRGTTLNQWIILKNSWYKSAEVLWSTFIIGWVSKSEDELGLCHTTVSEHFPSFLAYPAWTMKDRNRFILQSQQPVWENIFQSMAAVFICWSIWLGILLSTRHDREKSTRTSWRGFVYILAPVAGWFDKIVQRDWPENALSYLLLEAHGEKQ